MDIELGNFPEFWAECVNKRSIPGCLKVNVGRLMFSTVLLSSNEEEFRSTQIASTEHVSGRLYISAEREQDLRLGIIPAPTVQLLVCWKVGQNEVGASIQNGGGH